MPSRLCLQRRFIVPFALLLGLQLAQAQTERAPRQLIDGLSLEVRKILEDPKSGKTPEDAERTVAEQIAALIRSDAGHLTLTELDSRGRTPLMLAASSGYPLVVQALLKAPNVQLTVNLADTAGETAWMKAQFAPSATLVACQPGALTLDRAQLLPAYLRRMVHLLNGKGAALAAVIQALEAAGAEAKPDDAKRAWLARCPNATPGLRQALAERPLLPTLINESIARQREFNKAGQDKARSLPAKPPSDMKFVREGAGGQRVARLDELLLANGIRCDMPKPPIPRINWSGDMEFRVVVSTRAGIVETADVEITGNDKNGRVADALFASILAALSGYRCEGDHVFEQDFKFSYS